MHDSCRGCSSIVVTLLASRWRSWDWRRRLARNTGLGERRHRTTSWHTMGEEPGRQPRRRRGRTCAMPMLHIDIHDPRPASLLVNYRSGHSQRHTASRARATLSPDHWIERARMPYLRPCPPHGMSRPGQDLPSAAIPAQPITLIRLLWRLTVASTGLQEGHQVQHAHCRLRRTGGQTSHPLRAAITMRRTISIRCAMTTKFGTPCLDWTRNPLGRAGSMAGTRTATSALATATRAATE